MAIFYPRPFVPYNRRLHSHRAFAVPRTITQGNERSVVSVLSITQSIVINVTRHIFIEDVCDFDAIITSELIPNPSDIFDESINDFLEFDTTIGSELIHQNILSETINDILILTDSSTFSLIDESITHTATLSDTLIINESLTLTRAYHITINQTLDLTSDTINQHGYNKQLSDKLQPTQTITTNHNANYFINDVLTFTQVVNPQSPVIVLTTRSGGRFEIKAAEVLTLEDFNFNNTYKISQYATYYVTESVEKIKSFKRFLNYYHNEPIYVTNVTGVYEARLDFSENTRRSLEMFKDDESMTLNFYVMKIG